MWGKEDLQFCLLASSQLDTLGWYGVGKSVIEEPPSTDKSKYFFQKDSFGEFWYSQVAVKITTSPIWVCPLIPQNTDMNLSPFSSAAFLHSYTWRPEIHLFYLRPCPQCLAWQIAPFVFVFILTALVTGQGAGGKHFSSQQGLAKSLAYQTCLIDFHQIYLKKSFLKGS